MDQCQAGSCVGTPSSTPPSCALTHVISGPPKQLEITVQDPDNGLASVEIYAKPRLRRLGLLRNRTHFSF